MSRWQNLRWVCVCVSVRARVYGLVNNDDDDGVGGDGVRKKKNHGDVVWYRLCE